MSELENPPISTLQFLTQVLVRTFPVCSAGSNGRCNTLVIA
jgi:hypothetical protein